jgi:pheromone shutdown protein TraB
MIGTAHISEESAKLVRRTIKTIKPDVIMIELDPKRIGRIAKENQTLQEAG